MAKLDETAAVTQPGGALLTPYEHGRKAGIVRASKVEVNGRRGVYRTPEFRAAEALHFWSEGDDNKISEAAFSAAIEAGKTADPKGNYTPHAAALPSHLRGK